MNFNSRLLLCAAMPAVLFVAALSASLWGLLHTQAEFDRYIGTEQAMAAGLSDMYAQGLQMGQALRNIVLDPANQKAYDNFDAAQAAYAKAQALTEQLTDSSPLLAPVRALAPLRAAQALQQQQVLELVKTDPAAAVQALNRGETPAWRELRARLLEQMAAGRTAAEAAHAQTNARAGLVTAAATLLALLAALASACLGWTMARTVAPELGGEPAAAREALRRIADGELGGVTGAAARPGSLMAELQRTRAQLRELVAQVRASTDSIHTASAEIASGNADLSSRTEQTASSLQQTASSMAELTGTVGQSADAARQAKQLAASAAEVAQRGGAVVSEVVATMGQIDAASKRIADIIGVIDGIAFQTNILALNAAVEAARAGEQGRGFAVVASEVRLLAQRSAGAAREIKGLIGTSVSCVDAGTRQVADAGSTMADIVGSVQRVSDIIGEITAAAGEQSQGIGQVNGAVCELDRMTQQNAALVEQSAAAAESLKDQAQRLAQVVATFRLQAA